MEFASDRYYNNTGRVPFGGVILIQLFAVIAGAIGGLIYGALTFYNPFIYINFLATFGFGLLMGVAVQMGATVGKVRSRFFTALLGFAAGVLGMYFAWVFYLWCLFEREFFLWNPTELYNALVFFSQMGIWEMKGWTPTGWTLIGFWLVEAAIVIGTSTVAALSNDAPFCDDCNEWTDSAISPARMPHTDIEQLRSDLENENYAVIEELQNQPAPNTDYLQASVHSCPNCEDSNYLTVSHVTITTDSDGDLQTNSKDLIKHLWIPFPLAEHLKTVTPQDQVLTAEVEETSTDTAEDVVDYEPSDADSHDENR